MRITHLISNLDLGGAEGSLCGLVEATRDRDCVHTIISMLPHGLQRSRLEQAGAEVIDLPGARGVRGALLLRRIGKAIRQSHPDLIQCWMYHANVAASALGFLRQINVPIIWGVRQGAQDLSVERLTTRAVILAGSLLSRQPASIIYNSARAAEDHERLGYSRAARVVITNGIDGVRFAPRPGAREALCNELGLSRDAVLIGRVARYVPMKDYPTLLQAFSAVARDVPNAHLLLIGPSNDQDSADIQCRLALSDARERVHILQSRADIERFYAAIDVLVSSSITNEGFPNTVAEALACGTLVAGTNVGAEELVAGGCHRIVRPGDHHDLARAIMDLIRLTPAERGAASATARDFIQTHFNQAGFALAFMRVWSDVVEGAARHSAIVVGSEIAHPKR